MTTAVPLVKFLLLKQSESPIRKMGDLFSKISHPKVNLQKKGAITMILNSSYNYLSNPSTFLALVWIPPQIEAIILSGMEQSWFSKHLPNTSNMQIKWRNLLREKIFLCACLTVYLFLIKVSSHASFLALPRNCQLIFTTVLSSISMLSGVCRN